MAHDAVETVIVERLEVLGVSPHIPDTTRLVLLEGAGIGQQPLGDIDTHYGRTEIGQQPRIPTLTARDREHPPAADITNQLLKDRILQTTASRSTASWYSLAFSS